LTYDSRNRFVFEREEESLWLKFSFLRANFVLKNKESQQILKDVKRVA